MIVTICPHQSNQANSCDYNLVFAGPMAGDCSIFLHQVYHKVESSTTKMRWSLLTEFSASRRSACKLGGTRFTSVMGGRGEEWDSGGLTIAIGARGHNQKVDIVVFSAFGWIHTYSLFKCVTPNYICKSGNIWRHEPCHASSGSSESSS